MSENGVGEASWPDRFVYVCTAGRGASVNVAPMLHAGNRVKGLVVLVPVINEDKPGPNDLSEAILPAERIEKYARTALGLKDANIRRVYGHPDLIATWTGALEEAGRLARGLAAEVVFNITGGRKPATLGAILGIGSAVGTPVSLVTVGSSASVVRLVQISDGTVTERPLPTPGTLPFDIYLATYGYTEINRQERVDWMAWVDQRDQLMHRLSDMRNEVLREAFAPLNRKFSQFKEIVPPVEVKLSPKCCAALAPITDLLEESELNDGKLLVRSANELRFLRGGWLEALVYRRLVKRVGSRSSLSVRANIFVGRSDGQRAETEFDLAILGDDRLDLVEVKAVMDTNGLQAAVTKLAHYRNLLAGQGGRAWLVLPLAFYSQAKEAELVERAKTEGVTLCVGNAALPMLLDELAARHGAR